MGVCGLNKWELETADLESWSAGFLMKLMVVFCSLFAFRSHTIPVEEALFLIDTILDTHLEGDKCDITGS
jgi:hypothetical protein